jgi:hypothetical protein
VYFYLYFLNLAGYNVKGMRNVEEVTLLLGSGQYLFEGGLSGNKKAGERLM